VYVAVADRLHLMRRNGRCPSPELVAWLDRIRLAMTDRAEIAREDHKEAQARSAARKHGEVVPFRKPGPRRQLAAQRRSG
jgi:hypothetical protein